MAATRFFILSPRGDTIISKHYRGDVVAGEAEAFFRAVKFWEDGDAPPVLCIDDINHIYVSKNGLIFCITTKFNVSPSLYVQLLEYICKVFKDYCGVLSEEAIRKNFTLLYELLDELLDYGYPQGSATENLRNYVHNEPIVVESARASLPKMGAKTQPSSAVRKPIAGAGNGRRSGRNEIFVDIIERLNVLFSPNGYVLNASIDGHIQMKSYLNGNPELKLALNEDLVIGAGGSNYGAVVLDDANFHECVRLDEFEAGRILTFQPPEGEFSVLNYRIAAEFRAPFRVFPGIEEKAPTRLELNMLLRADIPEKNHGANIVAAIPMPRATVSATAELASGAGQSAEYNAAERTMVWSIKKLAGGNEATLTVKIVLDSPATAATKKEIGPVSLGFEIPMYNVSNLQVRYLRIADAANTNKLYRWVRYITAANSYCCRV